MSWSCVQGDTLEPMPLQLQRNGSAYTLEEGDAIVLHYLDPDGVAREKVLDVVDAPTGQLEAQWEVEETEVVGPYLGQVRVTRFGESITFPDDGSMVIWWVYRAL